MNRGLVEIPLWVLAYIRRNGPPHQPQENRLQHILSVVRVAGDHPRGPIDQQVVLAKQTLEFLGMVCRRSGHCYRRHMLLNVINDASAQPVDNAANYILCPLRRRGVPGANPDSHGSCPSNVSGQVKEGLSELGVPLPSWHRRGGRDSRRSREASFNGADGVVQDGTSSKNAF